MKKIFLLTILFPTIIFCQQDHIYIIKDTVKLAKFKQSILKLEEPVPALLLSNGTIVYQGEKLTLGKGTLPNGDFNYIATPSNTMEAKLKAHNNLKGIEVTEIKKRGDKKFGYKYIVIGEGNHLIQLEDAIATGEIILLEETRPKEN
jgi:hypothetical protein